MEITYIFHSAFSIEKEKGNYFGKIYAGEQEEQLLNVAVSRTRHKLIVICDKEYITKCPGDTISDKTYQIFKTY